MPLVKVLRIQLGLSPRTGGTYAVTGDANISRGLTIELNSSIFNQRGIWTLMTWTGALTGSISNITIANNTGLSASAVYQDGNAFKIDLS